MQYICSICQKSFRTQDGLNGHKRVHGKSNGTITLSECSCIVTRKVVKVRHLHKYQQRLKPCKHCSKLFTPGTHITTFCSQSCAASYNNTVYVKRKKQPKPAKQIKVKKELSLKEIKARRTATVVAYRARKRNATPSDANLLLIKQIYEMCPEGYEVDHIIALAVGGMHHQENLQYLPALINRKKNKYQNYDTSCAIRWQDVINK